MYGQQDDISDDDTDETSSSLTCNRNVEDALASFREKWQQELRITTKKKHDDDDAEEEEEAPVEDPEEKAKMWYLKGAELERSGIFYEAIQCYKKAARLVPDIEFKIFKKTESINPVRHVSSLDEERHHLHFHDEDNHSDDEDIKEGALLQHIQRKMARTSLSCVPEYEQRALHISSLPTEILLYIFKWVVSSELDMRSLEICSMVSRGWFLAARDNEIWKLACVRVWGATALLQSSNTWRDMYLRRPRVHYNGCYISKTTYFRHGENSFQDQFYRPWHLVCYYRYLRFFPDGVVLMLTTPDEPHACVSQLKHRHTKVVLRGHYRLKDDRVILVVQDQRATKLFKAPGKGKSAQHSDGSAAEQTFHLEFQIGDQSKRRHVQLVWKHYSIFIRHKNGTESKTSFEIANNRFPPLWFSRVKSYTKETNYPLI